MAATDEDDRTLLELIQDTAQIPGRVLLSAPAKRAYISFVLGAVALFALYSTSVIAYSAFYYSYIPQLALSLPVHLQFDPAGVSQPWASVVIPQGTLASGQTYEVTVTLEMPRTSDNLEAGNFMVDMQLLGGQTVSLATSNSFTPPLGLDATELDRAVIARSRRSAILGYTPPLAQKVRRLFLLPLLVTGAVTEKANVEVSMLERVTLSAVPRAARIEVLSRSQLQIYGARLDLSARFSGLKWLMWRYKTLSFLFFTSAFCLVEVTVAALVWGLSVYLFSASRAAGPSSISKTTTLERESETEMSDTERSFPTTSSRQPPLKYESPATADDTVKIKLEDEEKSKAEYGDDEDEDEKDDFVGDLRGSARDDSGLGTSMESSNASSSTRDLLRRRRF